jgi:hypothetical protein
MSATAVPVLPPGKREVGVDNGGTSGGEPPGIVPSGGRHLHSGASTESSHTSLG